LNGIGDLGGGNHHAVAVDHGIGQNEFSIRAGDFKPLEFRSGCFDGGFQSFFNPCHEWRAAGVEFDADFSVFDRVGLVERGLKNEIFFAVGVGPGPEGEAFALILLVERVDRDVAAHIDRNSHAGLRDALVHDALGFAQHSPGTLTLVFNDGSLLAS
jgi:hypothetical protein